MGHKRLADAEIMGCPARKKKNLRGQRSSVSPDWAQGLPEDVLDFILDKLMSLGDYIRFGAVCTVWRSVVLADYETRNRRKRRIWRKSQQQLPFLFLPHPAPQFKYSGSCLYSITKEELLGTTRPLVYPCAATRFVGSSLGWLILIDADREILLCNPFRKDGTINTGREDDHYTVGCDKSDGAMHPRLLYPFSNRIVNYLRYRITEIIAKAILSADPVEYPDDYILALICGPSRNLVLFKPSLRRAWYPNITGADDVIYHSSSTSFYVTLNNGPIVSVSINELDTDHGVSIEEVAPATLRSLDCYKEHWAFIVENSRGNLLKIYRFGVFLDDVNFITSYFRVYEYLRDKECWDELKSLGDEVLFLGDNSSISIQASDFFGCLPGSIYYSFQYTHLCMSTKDPISANVPKDMGVFQLEIQESYPYKKHLTNDQWCEALVKQPPIWVVPTIQAP